MLVVSAPSIAGCSGGNDLVVTGSVAAPAGETVSAPITVDFFDVVNTSDTPERVATVKLDAPGDFKQTVSLVGHTLLVRALADDNGDGACTAGELWDDVEVNVAAFEDVGPLDLTLSHDTCPTDSAAK